jgi:hypothetical protein
VQGRGALGDQEGEGCNQRWERMPEVRTGWMAGEVRMMWWKWNVLHCSGHYPRTLGA